MRTIYTTINDVIGQLVTPVLGGHEDEYDLTGIAQDITETTPRGFIARELTDDELSGIIEQHWLPEEDREPIAEPEADDLTPETITTRAQIEAPIRAAIAATGGHLHTRVILPETTAVAPQNPPLILQLDFCGYPDGTPIWDRPLAGHTGKVTATRADGLTGQWDTDGRDWDDLTSAITDFMDGWAEAVAEELGQAHQAALAVDRIQRQLDRARIVQRKAARAAHQAGATKYRIAQVMGRTQSAVGKWVG